MIYLTIYLILFLPFWLFFGLLVDKLQPYYDTKAKVIASLFVAAIWPIVIIAMVIARLYEFLRIKGN